MLPATVGRKEMPLIQIHNNNKINALEISLANKLPHPLRNNTSHSPNAGKLMGSRFLLPSVPVKQGLVVEQEWQAELPVWHCKAALPSDFSFHAFLCYWPLSVLQNIAERFFLPLSKIHVVYINDIRSAGLCCGGCSKTLGSGWGAGEGMSAGIPDPWSLPVPSSFLGAAPGTLGEGHALHGPGSCWHSPGFHSPGTQQCCNLWNLIFVSERLITLPADTEVFMGCHKLWVTKLNIQVVAAFKHFWFREIPSIPSLAPATAQGHFPVQLFQTLPWFTPC